MEFVFKNITYKLTDWLSSYQGTDGYQTPTSFYRKRDNGIKDIYFPFEEDMIGLFLPLTSPDIHYVVFGENSLKPFAKIYNQIYKNPIYLPHEIDGAFKQIDDFLIRLPNLASYV